MGLESVIVDISSDDEDPDLRSFDRRSRFWLDELLDRAVERRPEDSDDVLVMDEFSVPLVKRRRQNLERSRPWKCGGKEDDNEDDCLVLESDPDKPVSVAAGEDAEDDLHVVAEKGQVACRDYPHSRDLCATFPFISSPHEKYCHLCHCYVCDSPAPCSYWGNGKLDNDHCHSTDKEERWKSLRQQFKKRNTVAQKSADDSTFTTTSRDSVPPLYSDPDAFGSLPFQPCLPTISNYDSTNLVSINQSSITPCHSQRPRQQPTRFFSLNHGAHIQETPHDGLTTQLMISHSRARSKSVGSTQSGHSSLANRSQITVSRQKHVPRAMPQRTISETITSQIPYCPRGQPRSQDLVVNSQCVPSQQMQETLPSQCTSASMQISKYPPITEDVYQKSWHDILASLASELGVSSCSDTGIMKDDQPRILPSSSFSYGLSLTENNGSSNDHPAPTTLTNPVRVDYDISLTHDTMGQIPEINRGGDVDLLTIETSNSMVLGDNTVSFENCLDSLLASIDNEI